MPVHKVKINGHYGYQYGNHGKVYFYDPKDSWSEHEAIRKANAQGAAIRAHGGK